jgi:two-component system, response regulator
LRYSRNAGGYEGVGRGKMMGTASVEEQKAILLVEDNEDQVVLAMHALRRHGIVNEVDEVVVAGDGGEALDYLFGEGGYAGRDTRLMPEFVLLDVDLPGMSGLEVLEKLRSDERTELLPVILFSASNRHRDVVEGYKLGANSYIAKPTSFSEFSEAMRLLGWYWLNWNESP